MIGKGEIVKCTLASRGFVPINQFTIANAEGSTLHITDATGRQLEAHNIIEANAVFDISNLPSGLYLVQVSRNGNTSFTKLIKN